MVKDLVSTLKDVSQDPCSVLNRDTDFFGRQLSEKDKTWVALKASQRGSADQFSLMMKACLDVVVSVLERQYKRYFEMDVTTKLQEETASARLHNIDAEEVMGMFSAGKERAKNASIDYLRAKMRAKKNHVVEYLNSLYKDKRDRIINWAVRRARTQRIASHKKQKETRHRRCPSPQVSR